MSLNVDRVWLRTAQGEVLVPVSQVQPGDAVSGPRRRHHPRGWSGAGGGGHCQPGVPYRRIHPGTKRPGGAVYAGTVVEEGECVLEVKQASGQSRYDQIVHMMSSRSR